MKKRMISFFTFLNFMSIMFVISVNKMSGPRGEVTKTMTGLLWPCYVDV